MVLRQGTAASGLTAPAIGDHLRVRYPHGRRFTHRFYSSWPGNGGRRIGQNESYVDIWADIVVCDVREVHAHGYDWIAVQFWNPLDGVELWTNYSRGRHVWMVRT